jgi:hypothetical protein
MSYRSMTTTRSNASMNKEQVFLAQRDEPTVGSSTKWSYNLWTNGSLLAWAHIRNTCTQGLRDEQAEASGIDRKIKLPSRCQGALPVIACHDQRAVIVEFQKFHAGLLCSLFLPWFDEYLIKNMKHELGYPRLYCYVCERTLRSSVIRQSA